jgi:secondary thiamine-phosphate synthase enzyme
LSVAILKGTQFPLLERSAPQGHRPLLQLRRASLDIVERRFLATKSDSLESFSTGHNSQGGRRMKSYRKELWFQVPTRRGFVNITPEIEECLRESGIREGFALCNAMHITASVFINDNESGLHHDYDVWLEKLAPHEPVSQYRHNVGEDNADAHMKRQIMGREVVVAVTEGKLDFGPWEQIFYGEFDGRRRKRVLVKIIGE